MNQKERNHRRAFGQNFLIDENVISNLCEDLEVRSTEGILEIGPGRGALTRHLVSRCSKLVAIEKDNRCLEYLRAKAEFKECLFINADASRVELETLWDHFSGIKDIHLVGNLPYNMTGPILKHFFPVFPKFKSCQFMVQNEVGKRMVASPGTRDFGSLSVMVQNYSEAKILRKIPAEAFRPKPNVFSATVRMIPHTSPVNHHPYFPIFVKQSFSQKRKKLSNCLGAWFSKQDMEAAFESLKWSSDIRAEQLSAIQHSQLFHLLFKKLEMVFNTEENSPKD